MKKFTISKVVFLCSMFFCTVMYGQKLSDKKIEFGKVYTMKELKSIKNVIRCSSTEYEQDLQAKFPDRMTDTEFEAWIAPLIKNSAAKLVKNFYNRK